MKFNIVANGKKNLQIFWKLHKLERKVMKLGILMVRIEHIWDTFDPVHSAQGHFGDIGALALFLESPFSHRHSFYSYVSLLTNYYRYFP